VTDTAPGTPPGTLLSRALRLRCVACGEGKPFTGIFRMDARCRSCGYRFEREPGYFMGSIYFNYMTTAVILVAGIFILEDGAGLDTRTVTIILIAFSAAFPVWFFRRARNLWIAFDHLISPPSPEDYGPPG
jgi:uncharacterized protein (DUF983 family)